MDKPKEFWILENGCAMPLRAFYSEEDSFDEMQINDNHIHVIEYSAYEQLQKKLPEENRVSSAEYYNNAGIYSEFGKIVCISVVLRLGDSIRVWSLGEEDASEAEIIKRFFSAIDKYDVTLVSWNGAGFDLPVLHYRAMLHQIVAPMYWELGDHYKEFRYNNYINRFHMRHIDLMDILSLYQARATQPLDQIATFLGFPSKMDMDGSQVYATYLNGRHAIGKTEAQKPHKPEAIFDLIFGLIV